MDETVIKNVQKIDYHADNGLSYTLLFGKNDQKNAIEVEGYYNDPTVGSILLIKDCVKIALILSTYRNPDNDIDRSIYDFTQNVLKRMEAAQAELLLPTARKE